MFCSVHPLGFYPHNTLKEPVVGGPCSYLAGMRKGYLFCKSLEVSLQSGKCVTSMDQLARAHARVRRVAYQVKASPLGGREMTLPFTHIPPVLPCWACQRCFCKLSADSLSVLPKVGCVLRAHRSRVHFTPRRVLFRGVSVQRPGLRLCECGAVIAQCHEA